MEHAQWYEQPVTPPPANLGRDEMNFALANVTEYILHRILKGSFTSTIFNSQIRPPKQKGKSPRYFSVIDLSLWSAEASLTIFTKPVLFYVFIIEVEIFWRWCGFLGIFQNFFFPPYWHEKIWEFNCSRILGNREAGSLKRRGKRRKALTAEHG